MNNRMIAFAGSALLVLGLFVPIIQLPMVGSVGLFGDGTNLFAYVLLTLAGLAAFLAAKERTHEAIWPGAAAAALVLALFISFQIRISQMKAQLAEGLEGNPFGGLASGLMDTVQLQWGWIVLVAAVTAILYGAVKERREVEYSAKADKGIKLGSGVLAVVGIGWLIYQSGLFAAEEPNLSDAAMTDVVTDSGFVAEVDSQPDRETLQYMAENVEVYDVSARYQNSMLDGRVPGVDFKVRNNGDRSLDFIEVTVVFYDGEGNAIAEETFMPVFTGGYNGDTPLRPGYIWQQERGRFYVAKSVPDEWESGNVSASVTEIEFSPEN